jgi:hypothetical protein
VDEQQAPQGALLYRLCDPRYSPALKGSLLFRGMAANKVTAVHLGLPDQKPDTRAVEVEGLRRLFSARSAPTWSGKIGAALAGGGEYRASTLDQAASCRVRETTKPFSRFGEVTRKRTSARFACYAGRKAMSEVVAAAGVLFSIGIFVAHAFDACRMR